jgi:hypothetical protein
MIHDDDKPISDAPVEQESAVGLTFMSGNRIPLVTNRM